MRRFFLIISVAMMAACGREVGVETSGLLRTVPSRSIEIMNFRNAGDALELLLDSTHVFRKLNLGRLAYREMVLSYDYSSSLVPLLAIDAGHAKRDTSKAVKYLLAQAKDLNLQTAYVVDSTEKRAAVLISPSSVSIAEALIHIDAGASILDAPDFDAATALALGSKGSIILRNSAANRWVPSKFMQDAVPHRSLVKFISGLCDWIIINFSDTNTRNLQISTVGDSDNKYLSIFSKLEGGKSSLKSILPDSTSFFIDLPLKDAEAFYDARCNWLDANSELRRHKKTCSDFKKASGSSPEEWLKQKRPQEVACIQWDGRSVIAVRCKKSPALRGISPNPIEGIPGILFGEVFSLPDESICSNLGKWLIIGSLDDVTAFCAKEKGTPPKGFAVRGLKFAVYHSGALLQSNKQGTKLNVYI
ncbi:MAG: hypothetical protein GX899_06510 [Rikenellaceae bacterium]|jgi:hypothetical protein|nr:hypothetical protein [Rikenellaceae bacterium]